LEASALRAPAGLARLALPSALLRLRSDDQLVALFRAGSDEAFGVIHDRYRARLFAYSRQMLGGSRSDAEDALQDVFLRAYSALRVDERPVVLKAWLYRVAHNRCMDHLRRPVPPAADVFEVSRSPLPDPLAEAERRDDLRRLVSDMQGLPEQQRSALLMREMEGLSYAELATALDTTVPAVKSLLVRARIGLVEAAEARNVACADIRRDLASSSGRGVRASARARRHMRECRGCDDYRTQLRAVQRGLGALAPAGHPLGVVAKLLGLGGAGGGAAAGGSAAAGGGAAVVGGGVVAGATAKVAAVVCCAALTAGGAVEIKRQADRAGASGHDAPTRVAPATSDGTLLRPGTVTTRRGAPIGPAAPAPAAAGGGTATKAAPATAIPRGEESISPHVATPESTAAPRTGAAAAPATGGALAPDEPVAATSGAQSQTTGTSGSGTAAAAPASSSSSSPSSSSSSTTSAPAGGTGSQSSTTATTASTSTDTVPATSGPTAHPAGS
jgi:RNA polymerase sigma factor (sigma-70 family)